MKRARFDVAAGQGPVQVIRTIGHRRPVDKALVAILVTSQTGTQTATVLSTITFPCTIVGLRWNINAITTAGTAPALFNWVIAVVRDGNTPNAIAFSDGATFYEPEQNVMTWGCGIGAPEDTVGKALSWKGDTKTMRKMMGGDTLQFLSVGEGTNTQEVRGVVQFFCKT